MCHKDLEIFFMKLINEDNMGEGNRIMLVSNSFEGYGAEYMLAWLGNMLAENGFQVYACAIYDKKKNCRINSNVAFLSIELVKSTNPLYFVFLYLFSAGFKLARLCKQNKITTVVTFKENPLCVALIAKMFCGFRHIHSERDDPYNRDTCASKFKMWLYRFTDHIVFQTKGAQKFFNQNIINQSTIIPNPVIIPSQSWNLDKAKKTIACVGRLDIRYKRQDILIKAFAQLEAKYNDWKLVFYGDGNDRLKLEHLVSELKIEERVVFYGKVENVSERLVNDGIFVLASDTEGMPNALMEAMALGMPVISTDCSPGGAALLLENPRNGIIVNRGDVIGMCQAISNMIDNPSKASLMGNAARVSMKKYSPIDIKEKWMMIF